MKTTYEKKIIDSFIDAIKLSGGTVEKIDGNYICISDNIGYIYAALKQVEPDPDIKAVVIYPDDSRILPFYAVKGYKSIPAKYNPGTVSEKEYINAKTGSVAAVPTLWDPSRRRCSYSNEKTGGIPSISTLAGSINANYSGAIPWNLKTTFNVCGTCSADCPGCYAKKLTRYPDKYIQLALNTIEAKTDPVRFFELVEKELFRDPWTDPRKELNTIFQKMKRDIFIRWLPVSISGTILNRLFQMAIMESMKSKEGMNYAKKDISI